PDLSGKRIACIGLGIMGAAMATNLARAGAGVKGWNRTKDKAPAKSAAEAGVQVCNTLEEAVSDAEVILTCLGDEGDVLDVLLSRGGIAECARQGAIIVDTTTIGPSAARESADGLAKKGLRFLDAPVTGGDIGARQGTLTILVGGD